MSLIGFENNFDKYDSTQVDTLSTPYDYGSVMHYARNAFATASSSPTIIPLLNSSAVLGQRIRLSPIDILEIQRYYGCVPTPSDPYATTSRTTTSAGSSLQYALDTTGLELCLFIAIYFRRFFCQ
jgi:hypothetical protein